MKSNNALIWNHIANTPCGGDSILAPMFIILNNETVFQRLNEAPLLVMSGKAYEDLLRGLELYVRLD